MFCILAVAEENAVLIAEHLVEILRMSLLMFSVIFQTTSIRYLLLEAQVQSRFWLTFTVMEMLKLEGKGI